MICNERSVDEESEPLPGEEEENVDEEVETILRQNQGVQTVALINGVLVVSLQFIKCDDLQQERIRRVEWKQIKLKSHQLDYILLD